MLIERYNEVKKHVEEACKRVGRDPREVTVIAVSKTKPLEMVEELRKEKEKAEKAGNELAAYAKDIAVTTPVNKGCKIIK